jgi:hypothetical protein
LRIEVALGGSDARSLLFLRRTCFSKRSQEKKQCNHQGGHQPDETISHFATPFRVIRVPWMNLWDLDLVYVPRPTSLEDFFTVSKNDLPAKAFGVTITGGIDEYRYFLAKL